LTDQAGLKREQPEEHLPFAVLLSHLSNPLARSSPIRLVKRIVLEIPHRGQGCASAPSTVAPRIEADADGIGIGKTMNAQISHEGIAGTGIAGTGAAAASRRGLHNPRDRAGSESSGFWSTID
jgi:hypothetical protein